MKKLLLASLLAVGSFTFTADTISNQLNQIGVGTSLDTVQQQVRTACGSTDKQAKFTELLTKDGGHEVQIGALDGMGFWTACGNIGYIAGRNTVNTAKKYAWEAARYSAYAAMTGIVVTGIAAAGSAATSQKEFGTAFKEAFPVIGSKLISLITAGFIFGKNKIAPTTA